MKSAVCIDANGRNDLIIGKRYEILETGCTSGIFWYKIKGLNARTCIADRFTKCITLNNNIRVI